jgi:hypothetical protein
LSSIWMPSLRPPRDSTKDKEMGIKILFVLLNAVIQMLN